MQAKQLDLTFVRFCNEKSEIETRNTKAKQYLESKKGKLGKTLDKIIPIAVSMAVISSVVALCIVTYVHYEVFGTLL